MQFYTIYLNKDKQGNLIDVGTSVLLIVHDYIVLLFTIWDLFLQYNTMHLTFNYKQTANQTNTETHVCVMSIVIIFLSYLYLQDLRQVNPYPFPTCIRILTPLLKTTFENLVSYFFCCHNSFKYTLSTTEVNP